ncbi:Uncharacterised protein [Yersinia nurmii]|uniref:Uncharacterized protein n=1 Tax=Yersinia nurmii TaxID=685706 RepID=A0ABP1YJE8_9GAMM|nr:Uncharacterised protein [Yersinia nurmii]
MTDKASLIENQRQWRLSVSAISEVTSYLRYITSMIDEKINFRSALAHF